MSTLTFLSVKDYREFGGITSVSTHGLRDFAYISTAGYSIAIKGTGLRYDAQNHLTGGTITSVTVTLGAAPVATWTGLSFAASQFANLAFAATPDLVTLSRLMLAGDDVVTAAPFDFHISGGAGNDMLVGNIGNDWLFGDSGRDTYDGRSGVDGVSFLSSNPGGHGVTLDLTLATGQILDDGYGNVENALNVENWEGSNFGDILLGNAAGGSMWGLAGDDSLRGGDGGDWLVGNSGNDSLFGDAGSDSIFGESGADIYVGGTGIDFVIFQSGDAGQHGAVIDMTRLQGQVRDDGFGNIETMTEVEYLVLTRFNDRATGNNIGNLIFGNYGNDAIFGQAGNDTLVGNAGNDRLTGGIGADHFAFDDNLSEAGLDHVADMRPGLDKITVNHDWVSNISFGAITANRFLAGDGLTNAATASQRFIYDTRTGSLYVDADGVGGAAAVKFAVLDNLAAITFHDIMIVGNL